MAIKIYWVLPSAGVSFKRWPRWCRRLRVEHLRYGSFCLYDGVPLWAERALRVYFSFVFWMGWLALLAWCALQVAKMLAGECDAS